MALLCDAHPPTSAPGCSRTNPICIDDADDADAEEASEGSAEGMSRDSADDDNDDSGTERGNDWRHCTNYDYDAICALLGDVLRRLNSTDLDMNGWRYYACGAYEPRPGYAHGSRAAYTPRYIAVCDTDVHRQFVIACAWLRARTHIRGKVNRACGNVRVLKGRAAAWWSRNHPHDDAYIAAGPFICALLCRRYLTVPSLMRSAPMDVCARLDFK
jgi:hypothetical protein